MWDIFTSKQETEKNPKQQTRNQAPKIHNSVKNRFFSSVFEYIYSQLFPSFRSLQQMHYCNDN